MYRQPQPQLGRALLLRNVISIQQLGRVQAKTARSLSAPVAIASRSLLYASVLRCYSFRYCFCALLNAILHSRASAVQAQQAVLYGHDNVNYDNDARTAFALESFAVNTPVLRVLATCG